MRRQLTVTMDRRVRLVASTSPGWITAWTVLAWIAAAGTLADLVTQDWSDALDGGVIAFLFWALADRSRDVNALMGGHR